jgi:MFS superfamily sulfate permease-like transporter
MRADAIRSRFKRFITVFDSRFEDLRDGNIYAILYRDFSAGLIVAMTAIPMAMGLAMASGFRPEQGIIAGAIACLVGRTFGGSKYQVYGPTAAFIPLLAAAMSKYGHSFVVLASILSGIILIILALLGLGRVAKKVPASVVIGFTIGIAVAIGTSTLRDGLGMPIKGSFFSLLREVNPYSIGIMMVTFLLCRYLMRISVFIPAPLIAIGTTSFVASQWLSSKGILLVADRYGTIPHDFFKFTPPQLSGFTPALFLDLSYFVLAIVFISGIESLLCSSMADRLANNKKTLFDADKEFWGQGWVQIITPLINGFPCTGALARTATSIKAGAVTPFAGYFKGILKLVMAYMIASYLEHVPLACVAGILLWVASNMIKTEEIKAQFKNGYLPGFVVVFTAIAVPLTDFMTGVMSALIIYFVGDYFIKKMQPKKAVEVEPRLRQAR